MTTRTRAIFALLLASVAVGAGVPTASAANPNPVKFCASRIDSGDQVGEHRCSYDAAAIRGWATAGGRKILAQFFQYPDYQGRWYMVTSPIARCSASVSDHDAALLDIDYEAWGNRISSVKTDLSGDTRCSVRLYRDNWFDGPSQVIHHYYRDLRQVGFDDRTSSVDIT